MSREKQLVKNTGIIAIGRLSTKFFSFFLLPIYTKLLIPEDYGTVDVVQTVTTLLLYFFTLQMESAVFRFLIDDRDDEDNIKKCVSSAAFVLVVNSVLITTLIIIANFVYPIPYLMLMILTLVSSALFVVIVNVARGLGHIVTYTFGSFLTTAVALIINIILIVGLRMGAKSILIASVVSHFIGTFYAFVRERIWKYLDIRNVDRNTLRDMTRYSLPLIPNAVSWWVANTSDRLLIRAFVGSFANGLYAAANKIPTIYTSLFSVFNLAWSESVSLTMKDEDRDEYINKMLGRSLKLFSFLNLAIITCISLVFDFLIGEKYSDSYPHVCILLIAVFINSVCSLYGGILTGFKDSKTIGYTTVFGALVNFAVNICMIRTIGLFAASFSTLISYIVIMLFRHKAIMKYTCISLDKLFLVQLLPITAVVIVAYLSKNVLSNVVVLIFLIIWGSIHNKEIINKTIEQLKMRIIK